MFFFFSRLLNVHLNNRFFFVIQVRQQGHMFMNTFRMLRSGAKTYSAVMKMNKKDKENEEEDGKSSSKKMEEQMSKMALQQTSLIAETLWNANVFDIESTLRKTCWKVLHDRSCTKSNLALRAKSLKLVGTIFQKMGLSTDDGLKAITEKMKAQFEQETQMREAATAAKKKKSVLEMKRKLESAGVSTRACLEASDVEELYSKHFGKTSSAE